MSYFTAVIVRDGDKWFARDLDVEALDDLEDLADALRGLAHDDQPALAFVEREDAWWSVVRIDGDDDPRVFVSDVAGAAASSYAAVLEVEPLEPGELAAGTCGGDFDLLADLGTTPDRLQEMCEDELVPMDALAALAEPAGFAEVLDSLR